jgi:integrase
MAIKFESNGTFTVLRSMRHPITKQPITYVRKGIKSKAEAKRVDAELIVKIHEKIKETRAPKWPQLQKQYIDNLHKQIVIGSDEQVTRGTIYKREKTLTKHTSPAWDHKPVDQITGNDIRNLLEATLDDNSESHRKFFIKGIRAVLQFAVDEGILQRNPTPMIKFKISDKIKSVLNEDQIVSLLRKAQEQEWEWYYHYAVGLYTGLRSGEMFALPWENVNLERRQILVNCAWSSKDGFKSTKSGNDRVVEIPLPLVPVLTELKLKTYSTGFVLPRIWKWEQGEQARMLRLFLKSNGLPEIRFHDLRASWATLLLSRGVAPSKVMSMGGWSDMKTMLIYMRKAGIDIKGATDCLDDMKIHGVQPADVIQINQGAKQWP